MKNATYAVIGNPISHSQSPFIHAEFARQTGEHLEYSRLQAPLDGFEATVRTFMAEGGRGLNVTLPFKLEAAQMCTQVSAAARIANAVNTMTFLENGEIHGDNTDGIGLIRDITVNLDQELTDKNILVLGAGGAVRGVLQPLLAQKPTSLTLVNRTREKAEALSQIFANTGTITVLDYADLAGKSFDVIINGTTASLNDETPPLPEGVFSPNSLAYDMMYSAGLTPFLRLAQKERAGILADGVGMLVEQAAESFLIWRGIRPETRAVMGKLRELLA